MSHPLRRLALLPVLGLAASLSVLVPVTSASGFVDHDCGDFDTQRQAQRFFGNHNPGADPHQLDSDGDGLACEDLPCPCNYEGGGTAPAPPAVKRDRARIVEVIDGDTVRVRMKGRLQRVRLLGIDTPEVYGRVECGGTSASRSARKQLPKGSRVVLISDPTQDLRDRYGRLLRYVERKGHDIGRTQVLRGWAQVYVYAHHPFKRVDTYRHARAKAKATDRGVWQRCGGRFHRPV